MEWNLDFNEVERVMSTSKKREKDPSTYSAPVLTIYGEVARLTASGTRGDTEDPTDPRPDPQRKP